LTAIGHDQSPLKTHGKGKAARKKVGTMEDGRRENSELSTLNSQLPTQPGSCGAVGTGSSLTQDFNAMAQPSVMWARRLR
jgi:hypothetical protein